MRKFIGLPKAAWLAITRKPLQWLFYALLAAFFLHADLLAGVVFIIASQLIRYVLTHRNEIAFRRSLVALVAIVGLLGFVAALGMPTYRATPGQPDDSGAVNPRGRVLGKAGFI